MAGERNPSRPPEDESATPTAATGRLRADGLTRPRPDRLDPTDPGFGAAMEAHDAAAGAGSEGYFDPETGLFVMTARYLADRGSCCRRGCRHCPYDDAASIH